MQESKDLEFKECVTNSFLKTVSAYANGTGGRVLFGINDDGEAVGLDDPKQTCLDIENKINDSIIPQPDYSLKIDEPDATVELTVFPGRSKPYLYRSKAYKRNGTATIPVDTLGLSRLVLEGQNLSFEQLPANKQDLSFTVLENRLTAKLSLQSFTTDTLKTLGLLDETGTYNNAAELLADENGFPGIDIAVFGETINLIKQRKTLEHASVLAEIDGALELFEAQYCYEEIQGMERIRKELIPLEAFREAITNAVVHRTWDAPAHIRISMFDDRVEVASPGGLPASMTVDEYLSDMLSVRRNRILAEVFLRLGLIEAFGTGIMRIRDTYKDSVRKPRFQVSDNAIVVTLPLLMDNPGLKGDELIVFGLLSGVHPQSTSELAAKVTFSRSKLLRILKKLVETGLATVEGTGRGQKYRLQR